MLWMVRLLRCHYSIIVAAACTCRMFQATVFHGVTAVSTPDGSELNAVPIAFRNVLCWTTTSKPKQNRQTKALKLTEGGPQPRFPDGS